MAVPDIGENLAKKCCKIFLFHKELLSQTYESKNVHFVCMDCLESREPAWHEAGKLPFQVTVHRDKSLW